MERVPRKGRLLVSLLVDLRHGRLLLRYFAVFSLLVVVTAAAAGLLVSVFLNRLMEKERELLGGKLLASTVSCIDAKLSRIRDKIYLLSTNSDLINLLYDGTYGERYRSAYIRVKDELIKLANDEAIDEAVIYFPQLGRLLARGGLYDFDFYFDRMNRIEGYDGARWKDLETEEAKFRILGSLPVSGLLWDGGGERRMIVIRTTLPYDAPPRAVLLLLIDERYIRSVIEGYGDTGGSICVVTDGEDKVIARTGGGRDAFAEVSGAARTEPGMEVPHATSVSTLTGWTYRMSLDGERTLRQARGMRALTWSLVAALVLAGLVASGLLARRQYKPIATLIGYLDQLNGIDPDAGKAPRGNEYSLITRGLDMIRDANVSLRRSLNTGLPLLQENLFYRLLIGNFTDEEGILEEARGYGVAFPFRYFTVVSARVDALGRGGGAVRDRIKAVVAAMLQKAAPCWWVEVEAATVVFVANTAEEDGRGIASACRAAADFFNAEQYGLRLTLGMGGTHPRIDGVRRSYREAATALGLRRVSRASEAVRFAGQPVSGPHAPENPERDVKSITHGLLGGETEKAIGTAVGILDAAVREGVGEAGVRSLMRQFVQAAAAAAEMRGCRFDGMDAEDPGAGPCLAVEDYRRRIGEIYAETARRLSLKGGGRKGRIAGRVLDIVRERYREDIFLESIADELAVSTNYLSHFFKDTVGMSFSDYLGRFRVDRAKELLRNPAATVQQVGFAVGYRNVNSFIRSFRKFEGISPGRYRVLPGGPAAPEAAPEGPTAELTLRSPSEHS